MKLQKHHIVPRYKCKELGIDPDFDDNIVEVTRLQHANIHWGYWCKDLSALLEVCSPPQYVIDMIPLGDKRDLSSAKLLAEGEIDGIDMSGENNPMFGKKRPEHSKKMSGKNNPMFGVRITGENHHFFGKKRPEHSKKMSGEKHPNYKNGNTVGLKSPDRGVRLRASKKFESTPERKEYKRVYNKQYNAKKKLEKQKDWATLEPYMG